eukprot:GFYU01004753.1.p1 GENE.GFYU01004753.1~~GFYU01004753.1.p1  ORF type:complete len:479 (-),score=88.74 GFYU01004753.1:51-1487(-)
MTDQENEVRNALILKAFNSIDTDSSGIISRDEILETLKSFNQNATMSNVQKFLNYFDTDGTGNISYEEFKTGIVKYNMDPKLFIRSGGAKREDYSVILRAFNSIDEDGDGWIGEREILHVLKRLNPKATEANVQKFLNYFEHEADGHVSYEQFKTGIIKYKLDPKLFVKPPDKPAAAAPAEAAPAKDVQPPAVNGNNKARGSSGGEAGGSSSLGEFEVSDRELVFGKTIGEGSFGTVRLAKWRHSDVAVKSIKNMERAKKSVIDDFKTELEILSQLRHPNIVLLLGACVKPPSFLMITEYVPGGNLFELLHQRGEKLSNRDFIKIAKGIARGVNYLHLRSPPLIHRDLKSLNILLDEAKNPKIADFGLSRTRALETQMTTNIGTPLWMAPEVIRNEKYDEKVDVYSYGVVLWEMLTNKIPYTDKESVQVAVAVAYQGLRPKIPSSCNPKLKKLLEDCWNDDCSKRPTFEMILNFFDSL